MDDETRGRVIVFEEKHGRRMFLVDTPKLLLAAALKVLRERDEEGYWYEEPERPEGPSSLALTDEQVSALSESQREAVWQDRREHAKALSEYESDLASYRRLRDAVDRGDGALAFRVLTERASYEYEGWSFEYLEEVGDA